MAIEVKLNSGGLFRCCVETACMDAEKRNTEPQEGERLTCIHCKKETMVYRHGAWEWNRR